MKFTQLKNSLNDGESSSIYLLEGEDDYFKNKSLKLIIDKFLSEPTFNYAEFDGNGLDMSALTASLSALPLMSEKRITAVKNFYPTKDVLRGDFKNFLENPPSDEILIISNDKASESLKKFTSVTVVDCGKEDASVLSRWVIGECGKNSVTTDRQTAALICEYCLCDMTRIETETEKLIDYAGKGGVITAETVELLVNRDNEYKIYEMTDCIGKRRNSAAIEIIKEMLSKGETAQRITVSIYNYFRRLLHIAISDKSDKELSELFGVKEYAVKKTREQAKMFRKKSLKFAVDFLSDSDYKVKSGVTDADENMWLSFFEIVNKA